MALFGAVKKKKLLGDILMDMGLIDSAQVKEYLEKSQSIGRRFGKILVEEGVINSVQLAQAIATKYEMDFCDIRKYNINPKATKLISINIARQTESLPIDIKDGTIVVAISDPENIISINRIKKEIIGKVDFVVASNTEIELKTEEAYLAAKNIVSSTDTFLENLNNNSIKPKKDMSEVESLVDSIISRAVINLASDIHIEPQEKNVIIRERIDGLLDKSMELPIKLHANLVSRIKILANLNIAEKRHSQDGRFSMMVKDRKTVIRVSTLPTVHGEKVVLRILDRTNLVLDFAKLGFSEDLINNIESLLAKPYGILFVTGPTGSGKTTSIYSMLQSINSIEKNITSIEDPVEYQLERINQVQINPKIDLTFASVLKNILRQDPDVIMIGEIRDRETADIAIRAALTGHLVISTMHTNDSISAVTRLVDLGIDPFMVSSSLLGVLSQRLVRKLCPKCKKEIKKKEDLNSDHSPLSVNFLKDHGKMFSAVGCSNCHNTGFIGREGIYELFIPDYAMKEAIHNNTPVSEIRKKLLDNGWKSLRDDGIEKVKEGVTSLEEIIRSTT